jgi:hypothetical protein
LAHGQSYQRAYQEYESKQISAGKNPEDAEFFDGFWTERGVIATKVGPEDQYVTIDGLPKYLPTINYPSILICAGLGVLLGVGLFWIVVRRRRNPSTRAGPAVGDRVAHREDVGLTPGEKN